MVTLILISHGGLAQSMLDTVELLMGHQEDCYALGLDPGEPACALATRCRPLLRRSGAVVLTDLLLGSPTNVVFPLLAEGSQLVTGMNLGMVVEALWARKASDDPREIAISLVRQGRAQITLGGVPTL